MLPSIVFVRHCVVLTLFAHLANVESSHTAASRARLSMASYCSCLCLLCFMHAYIRVLILYYVLETLFALMSHLTMREKREKRQKIISQRHTMRSGASLCFFLPSALHTTLPSSLLYVFPFSLLSCSDRYVRLDFPTNWTLFSLCCRIRSFG